MAGQRMRAGRHGGHLGGDDVDAPQDPCSAQRQILEVADRRADEHEPPRARRHGYFTSSWSPTRRLHRSNAPASSGKACSGVHTPRGEAASVPDWVIKPDRWFGMIAVSGAAVICLPRMFQVMVVEDGDERVLQRMAARRAAAEALANRLEDLSQADDPWIGKEFGALRAARATVASTDRAHVGAEPQRAVLARPRDAAATTFALGAQVPLFGVVSLDAIALAESAAHQDAQEALLVTTDARRGEVYVQSFFADGPSPARIARADAIGDTEPQTTGSAAQGLPEAMPLVEAIARIAASRPGVQPRPAPFYLRGADAAPPSDPPPTILPDPVGA